MNRTRPLFLALFLLLAGACSEEVLAPTPTPPTTPPTPSLDCRIAGWINRTANGPSYEFQYADKQLTGMVQTAPGQPPTRYRFAYTGEQLTGITQTNEDAAAGYDSLLTHITYDTQGRPMTLTTVGYVNAEPDEPVIQELNYDAQRFQLRTRSSSPGPYTVFLQDNAGNIEFREDYNRSGGLTEVQTGEFDARPSPFRRFPLAFKLHFAREIGLSWHNNVVSSRCESIPDDQVVRKQLDYSYNTFGYPIESRTPDETVVYRMVYGECE